MVQSLEQARFLIVDDHFDLADNVREILEEEGAAVMHAATAAQALDLACQPFDVALVDIRLPDATGLSLVPRLKALGDGISEVVLITGDASLEDAIEAVQAGAYDYVLKPFDPSKLLASLERAVNQVRIQRRALELASKLEAREANLRTVLETVQALLVVLDEHGRIELANQAVASALGMDAGGLAGRKLTEFVPVTERSTWETRVAALLAGDDAASFESRLTPAGSAGGADRHLQWQLRAILRDGRPQIYASGLDVTDVQALEQRTRLSEKLAAVGTLAAGLAHEIRNPLNAGSLQLQLLERRIAKSCGHIPEADRMRLEAPVAVVREEIQRLSHLVEDFLNFARPTELHPRRIDLAALVLQLVELEGPAAQARNIALVARVPEEEVRIEADREKLRQVLLNLVNNALEAVGKDGSVEVEVRHDGDGAVLHVRDDGPGIPEEQLARIFEPFFSTKEQGTGLGMAISHSLISLHGGDIRISCDDGTTVQVVLPARPPEQIALDMRPSVLRGS